MSSYFFGGFSEYAIVPSRRVVNHSGCSVTQGWSGDALSAKSRAISSPRSLAFATNRSNAAMSPRSGWMASWPPSAPPMVQVEPWGLDVWQAWVRADSEGDWTFRVEAWSDPWATWLHNAKAKLPIAQDVPLVCLEVSRVLG